MTDVRRILDANANRAREGMRVMEEAARFLLDDAALSADLKQLRHDFAAAIATIPGLAASRDTPGDVGVHISTTDEGRRASVADVATAAGKRLSEALRAIEEFGKLLPNTGFSQAIEAIRYRGYDIEQRLDRLLASTRATQWRLCVLITESLCAGRPWQDVAAAAVAGGADCLQLREKTLDAGELLKRARELVDIAKPPAAAVIINDRPDVALLAGAAGVHLGQGDLPCREARKLVGRQLIIGVSTSNLAEAKQAKQDGADYCGVGPMFPTTTKRKDHIVGPAYLAEYVAWGGLPHLAIGGVTAERIAPLREAGVRGAAVTAAVCQADDPRTAAAAIVAKLDGDLG